jgi:hypothetical protein
MKPIGEEIGQRASVIFEFTQNAARDWRVSGKDQRRGILCRTLLKRSLSATSLVTTKKKPFDLLAEGRFPDESRDSPHLTPPGNFHPCGPILHGPAPCHSLP